MTLDFRNKNSVSGWNYLYLFIIVCGLFLFLTVGLTKLQVVEGSNWKKKADTNQVRKYYQYPNRGIVYDRNGIKLVENLPASDVSIDLTKYYIVDDESYDMEALLRSSQKLEELLGERWKEISDRENGTESLFKKLEGVLEQEQFDGSAVLVASGLDSDLVIKIKANLQQLEGVQVRESYKRGYPYGAVTSHLLGYTSGITYEDLSLLDYLGYETIRALDAYQDNIGRVGLEKVYDRELLGSKGIIAIETDASGERITNGERELESVVDGANLHTSIDIESQKRMYEILVAGISKHKATGGVGILQDVESGEILAIASAPSYDSNRFVGGISSNEYSDLLNDPHLPLLDRSISAQLPPGSTFKTIAAAAALDAGKLRKNTVYVSRPGYTFSNGAPFQEYRGRSYGSINLVDAIAVSSNIYFCEMIRNWEIEGLVPYYEAFGIGKLSGIDLYGELPGRLPSPENKIELAQTPGITWLEPVWYPEGDGCNTVIGQGITLVTPVQMSNWVAAIANGGTLLKPHIVSKIEGGEGVGREVKPDPLSTDIASADSLKIVRDSMREAVAGSKGTIKSLVTPTVEVAAKTGTAEFGRLNKDGSYEHAHAWVTGFFPYKEPKYSFVILLEDGGESFYSAQMAREFIDWFVTNRPELMK